MTAAKSFCYDVAFLGRHVVHGSLSSGYLTGLISRSQRAQVKPIKEEAKCSIEIGDQGFSIHSIRKDEGFESDGESSASSLSEKLDRCDSAESWGKEKKDKGKDKDSDDTSSANSSGSEHEEQDALPNRSYDRVKETYPMSDILFSHASKKFPNCIVFVIRHRAMSRSVHLEALVFQCKNDEVLRELSSAYSDMSKTLKLDRYRQNKRRNGEAETQATVTVNNVVVSGKTIQSSKKVTKIDTLRPQSPLREPEMKWNLVQHTDSNGVTHIEIEGSGSQRNGLLEDSSETDSLISFNTPETEAPSSLSFVTDRIELLIGEKRKGHQGRQRQAKTGEFMETPLPPPLEAKGNHRRSYSEGNANITPQPPPRRQKGPAPKPPPKAEKPNVIMVPTKSGSEPKKTLYPKESHVIRGKYVRINVMNNSYSPHYGYRMFNSRYVDINDMNNNSPGMWGGRSRYWSPSAEMHHTGRRGREMAPHQDARRRSRSKSPPRKPMAHRYIDVSLTGFSQKFKELSESVMPKKFRGFSDISSYTKYMKTDLEEDGDVNLSPQTDGKCESRIEVIEDTRNKENVKPILKKSRSNAKSDKAITFSQYSSVQIFDPL